MRDPEEFDAFYASARDRLLLETFALTGDLTASRAACQAAFAAAWHHWRKVAHLDDREGWVRPRAHRRAGRRHTARLGRRERSLPAEQAATLDALAGLSQTQRKALVLVHLSALPMADIGREVEVTQATLERELQTASASFALARDVETTRIRSLLEGLRVVTEAESWPRASIVRRAGAARRRTHTLVGVGAVVASMLVAGSVVTAGGAVPASLDGPRGPAAAAAEEQESGPDFGSDEMLAASAIRGWGADVEWSETDTSDGADGDAAMMPCQLERFADAEGFGALVRQYRATETVERTVRTERRGRGEQGKQGKQGKRGKQGTRTVTEEVSPARIVESVEVSRSDDAAVAAFETTRTWYAGCFDRRIQLLDTLQVGGVGDDATLLQLRSWGRDPGRIAVGVARSGALTVTTMLHGDDRVDPRRGARVLADAVSAACLAAEAGACTSGSPRTRSIAPFPTGDPPGMLGEYDLPPVTDAPGPWVGTDPVRARVNVASTRCDRTEFRGKGIRDDLTRTFLFPAAKRAEEFGLTQTVGRMSQRQARAFVDDIQTRVRRCGEANLGTRVTEIAQGGSKTAELHAWHLDVEISDNDSVQFLMAVVRQQGTVSQIGFVPTRSMTMSRDDFRAVARRALDRLPYLR